MGTKWEKIVGSKNGKLRG